MQELSLLLKDYRTRVSAGRNIRNNSQRLPRNPSCTLRVGHDGLRVESLVCFAFGVEIEGGSEFCAPFLSVKDQEPKSLWPIAQIKSIYPFEVFVVLCH